MRIERPEDLYWLAGYLEGEGCFDVPNKNCCTVRITVESTDIQPIERVAKLMGSNVNQATYRKRVSKVENVIYRTSKSGAGAVEIMLQILPLLSPRRQIKVKECIMHRVNTNKKNLGGSDDRQYENREA